MKGISISIRALNINIKDKPYSEPTIIDAHIPICVNRISGMNEEIYIYISSF